MFKPLTMSSESEVSNRGPSELPEELLDMIFDQLDIEGLKTASMVCRRWAELAFSGRRMDRVILNVIDYIHAPLSFISSFLESNRNYRHIRYSYNHEDASLDDLLLLVSLFKSSLQTLIIRPDRMFRVYELQQILLKLPDLQHLIVASGLRYVSEKQKPFHAKHKLRSLRFGEMFGLPWDGFDIRTVTPNLECLQMVCGSQQALEVWNHFSGQLRTLEVYVATYDLFFSFCELAFPLLEVLKFEFGDRQMFDSTAVDTICRFLRNLTKLRQLNLACCVSKEAIESVAGHCPELVCLSLQAHNLQAHSLQSLGQLSKLKTLVIHKCTDNVFDGCMPIPALGTVQLIDPKFSDPFVLYGHLGIAAPRLWNLLIDKSDMNDDALQIICDNFKHLKFLRLSSCQNITDEGLKSISRLPILRDLVLNFVNISGEVFNNFLSNSIHYLLMICCEKITDDDLLKLPVALPSLQQLDIRSCPHVSKRGIDRLRAVMPSCGIIRVSSKSSDRVDRYF